MKIDEKALEAAEKSAREELANTPFRVARSVIDAYLRAQNDGLPPKLGPKPKPESTKKFFHIMNHRGQPDLRQIGLEPLKIWYEGAFFSTKDDRGGNNRASFQDLSFAKVRAAAGRAPLISCLDIERWANKDTWRVSPINVNRYVEACQSYRDGLPSSDHKFGLYSILPVRNYFHAVGEKDFAEWQRWNGEVSPIVDHVDMLFPSLYTFDSVFAGQPDRMAKWERYAIANIEEARRIALGKSVYPVIWPWYHPSANRQIEPDFWYMQMEVCEQIADGFVIWDDLVKTRSDWGKLPEWWDATEKFMMDFDE